MRASRRLIIALIALAGCGGGGSSSGGFPGNQSTGSGSSTSPASTTTSTTTPATTTNPAPVASPAAAPSPSPQPTAPPAGKWLKGDFHVHSTHSGDAQSIGDDITGVLRAASVAGLDFTTISDHRTSACLTDPEFTQAQTNLILIAGEEWGQPGHAGAHGLTRAIVSDTEDETQGATVAVQKIQAAVDDVHSMGGIWVLNHAIDNSVPWYWPVDRFDAIEVWNTCWALRNATDVTPADLQAWIAAHGLDQPGAPAHMQEADAAIAATGGGQNRQRLALYEAHLMAGKKIAAVGGGDSHYVFLPGQPTTVVYAATSDQKGILDGVKHARTFVKRAPDAPDVELFADLDHQGTFANMIGDEVALGHALTFKLHVKDAQDGKLTLVKNGAVLQEWTIGSSDFTVTFDDTPSAASWYRVDVKEKLDPNLPNGALLKSLVLGTASLPLLTTLTSSGLLGSFGAQLQSALNSGAPAVIWLLAYGGSCGVSVSPGSTRFPRIAVPPEVGRYLNVCIDDQDYGMGAVTSPIWVK